MPPKQQEDVGGEPQVRAEYVSSTGFTLCVKHGDICLDASDGRPAALHATLHSALRVYFPTRSPRTLHVRAAYIRTVQVRICRPRDQTFFDLM